MGAISLPEPSKAKSLQQKAEAALQIATQGNYARAAEMFEDVLALDRDNLLALNNLGVIRCQTGRLEEGVELLRRAHQCAPGDAHARGNYGSACCLLAEAKIKVGDYAGAVPRLRETLALDPGNTVARVNIIDSLFRTGQPAELSDFAPKLSEEALGKKLFIACMPKSGSSWLLNTLTTLTGFPTMSFTFAYLQNEQELYLPEMIEQARNDGVVQQHCQATAANVTLMQAFGIRPVVLVRNLFDTLVSLADFYAAGATINTFFYRDFGTLERDRQIDLVIDHYAPWYLQFVASWLLVEEEQRLDFAWLTYEEMMADKNAAIAWLSKRYDLGKSDAEIEAALAQVEGNKHKNRFNKGVAGRGEEELSVEQKDRVRRLASYFPSVSFERVGL